MDNLLPQDHQSLRVVYNFSSNSGFIRIFSTSSVLPTGSAYRNDLMASIHRSLDILEEFHGAQASALKIRDAIRANYLSRAKICSKLIKYPTVDDYKVSSIPLCKG